MPVGPIPHAPYTTHRKAIEFLSREKPGRILDAPAGEGYASKKLKELGVDVYALDLDPGDFKLSGINFTKADLNAVLPYPDSGFDYVLCLEGIEHLENPHHLLREFKRVLKPGGNLVLSTPNVLSVYNRIRYFLSGYSEWIHSQINLAPALKSTDNLERHINLIGFPELYYLLKENSFALEKMVSDRNCRTYSWGKFYQRVLITPIFLLAAVVIRFYSRLIRRDNPLKDFLLGDDLLHGESVIIKAKNIK